MRLGKVRGKCVRSRLLLVVSLPGMGNDDDVLPCESLAGARELLKLELDATADATDIWDARYRLALYLAENAEPPTAIHFGGFVHSLTWDH